MADETNDSDGMRPLSPEERTALRELIRHKTNIVAVSEDYAHLGWFARFALNVSKWVAGLVAGLVAWQTLKTGGWLK